MTEPRRSSHTTTERALREKTREVEVLHKISGSISSTLDLETVLSHIVDIVTEVTKGDACLLYLLSDSREELILRA
jgi:GAF domain-containing protein